MVIFVGVHAAFWEYPSEHKSITLLTKVVVVTIFASIAKLLNRERKTAIAFDLITVVLALLTYILYQMSWQVAEA